MDCTLNEHCGLGHSLVVFPLLKFDPNKFFLLVPAYIDNHWRTLVKNFGWTNQNIGGG